MAGETLGRIGGYRQPKIQSVILKSIPHSVPDIVTAAQEIEKPAISLYQKLLAHVEGYSAPLAIYAKQLIVAERWDSNITASILDSNPAHVGN